MINCSFFYIYCWIHFKVFAAFCITALSMCGLYYLFLYFLLSSPPLKVFHYLSISPLLTYHYRIVAEHPWCRVPHHEHAPRERRPAARGRPTQQVNYVLLFVVLICTCAYIQSSLFEIFYKITCTKFTHLYNFNLHRHCFF